MLPLRKGYEIIGYAYEAAIHCPACTARRFPRLLHDAHAWIEDSEGNPITPYTLDEACEAIADYDDSSACDTCLEPLDV